MPPAPSPVRPLGACALAAVMVVGCLAFAAPTSPPQVAPPPAVAGCDLAPDPPEPAALVLGGRTTIDLGPASGPVWYDAASKRLYVKGANHSWPPAK